MSYTDARGRPEIVAEPSLKTAAVTVQVVDDEPGTPVHASRDPDGDTQPQPAALGS